MITALVGEPREAAAGLGPRLSSQLAQCHRSPLCFPPRVLCSRASAAWSWLTASTSGSSREGESSRISSTSPRPRTPRYGIPHPHTQLRALLPPAGAPSLGRAHPWLSLLGLGGVPVRAVVPLLRSRAGRGAAAAPSCSVLCTAVICMGVMCGSGDQAGSFATSFFAELAGGCSEAQEEPALLRDNEAPASSPAVTLNQQKGSSKPSNELSSSLRSELLTCHSSSPSVVLQLPVGQLCWAMGPLSCRSRRRREMRNGRDGGCSPWPGSSTAGSHRREEKHCTHTPSSLWMPPRT